MRIFFLQILGQLLIIIPTLAQTGIYVAELKGFDTRMKTILTKYSVTGGQLAVTYQGRLVYNRGFGLADSQTQQLVQPNSIFRVASVSKAITSVALMHLYETGQVKLDDKVFGNNGILNDTFYQNAIDPRVYTITVRQLMSHSAGYLFVFPSDPVFQTYNISIAMGVAPPTNSLELIIKWALRNVTLNYNPGTSATYTNFAYAVLEKVIEKITQKDYEQYIRDSILAPMNITDMHAARTLKQNKYPNEVSYYDYPGAPLMTSIFTGIPNSAPATYGGYNYEAMTAAGGWVASAGDLCKLLVAVDRYNTKPDFLKPATIDTMVRNSINWPDYALGWFSKNNNYWHTGGIQGTAAVIHRNAMHELNWAILFNALPANYTPMYNEFMALVLDEFPNITTWPLHDLFNQQTTSQSLLVSPEISIFPNPCKQNCFVEFGRNLEQGDLELRNILGRLIFKTSISNSNQVQFNLEDYPSGLYHVVLNDGRSVTTKSIIIE